MRRSVLALTASLLTLTGCTLNTDYFSEYRGKNLLSNYDFDSTGNWQTTTYASGADSYMRWERISDSTNADYASDVAASTPTTDDAGHTAYRLEIKNLIQDGDFEAETLGSVTLNTGVGWSPGGSPYVEYNTVFTNSNTNPTNPSAINHQSLLFYSGGTGAHLLLNLASAISPWVAGTYIVHLDTVNVSTGTTLAVGILDASTTLENWDLSYSGGSSLSVAQSFALPAVLPGRFLQIGSDSAATQETAVLDNLRILLDQELFVKASFASLSSGSLPLLPGTQSGAYTFSINVRDDPTADSTNANHVVNRFEPSGITVKILGRAKNSASQAMINLPVSRPAGGWTSWTTLTFSGGLDFVDTDDALGGAKALVIEITPTIDGQGIRDAGSLLVAHPVLTYNP